MRNIRYLILPIAISATAVVFAQSVAPLPKALSGRWTAVVPGNKTFTDAMSVVFDDPVQSGPVTGKLTSRGVTCGAQNEPLTGTWDGTVLRMESKVYPNVNAQRPNGECGTGRINYVLTRKPGEPTFEGEAVRDGMALASQVTLAP